MKKTTLTLSALALAIQTVSVSALEAMDDESMANISGQSGVTIEMNPGDLSIGEISYSQDGVAANMRDININGLAGTPSITTIDIDSDGTLNLFNKLGARDFSVGGVGMTGSTGITNDFFSLRGATQGYSDNGTANDLTDDTGVFRLNMGSDSEGNLAFDGSQVGLFFDGLHFGDDGMEWIIDDLAMSAIINYGRLIVNDGDIEFDFGTFDNRGLRLQYEASAIGLSNDPNLAVGDYGDPGSSEYLLGNTFGALSVDLEAYGSLTIRGGGADIGEGITFIPSLTLINDNDDRPAFKYTDDGYVILARNFRGDFSTESGLTLDFEQDDANNPYMALRYEDLTFSFSLDDLVLGEEDGSALGSFRGQVLFQDGLVDGIERKNYLYFFPGGDIGSADGSTQQGITAQVGWNIVSASPEADPSGGDFTTPGSFAGKTAAESNTYFAMNDNGNWVYFNGFNGWGEGEVSLDLTSGPDLASLPADYYANPYNSATGQFDPNVGYDRENKVGTYDGLRIDFKDLRGEYSFAGVTVGTSEEEAMDSPYMGGTELLLAMEVFPSYSFTLNGNLTIAPGGQINSDGIGGTQGLTLNGDLRITDGDAAITVDEFGRGVWLTGVTYDLHMRGASIDVTEDGLTFNKGLTWSTIQVGQYNSATGEIEGGIIFGSRDDGDNLGAFTLERLEDGTTISVASGGAGEVCIGGSLYTNGGGCALGDTNNDNVIDETDSKRRNQDATEDDVFFQDRGDQGLTIKVKAKFAEAPTDVNDPNYYRYLGKGNRFSWTQKNGTTLTLDNFSTQDGPEGGNDYGLNIDLALDVARTKVRNPLLDENNDGRPDLVDADGNSISLEEVNEQGPLGFAVFGRVHFKQLNIDGLKIAATPDSTPQTLISQIVVQNADIQANLTATPIR
ncbi:DUF6160 family protein [Thalassolituus maritimus]|uniref:DUF6160 domain-containing protein n=1 Tax=Thalassolituus maritimus TaxID=484498 RepID=A0ABQ0A3F3_9GAMM